MIKKSTFSTFARYSLALLWCLIVTGVCSAYGQAGTKSVSAAESWMKGQPLSASLIIVEGP